MKKSLFLFFVLLKLSFFANGSTVSYAGYTLDTETNIVTGAGLEWMRWSSTVGTGLTDLNYNAYSGWRLATSDEVVGLLDAFSPVSLSDAVANTGSFSYSAPYADGLDSFDQLINIMGDNYYSGQFNSDNVFSETGAVFSYINEDGEESYGSLSVQSDYKTFHPAIPDSVMGEASSVSLNLGLLSQSVLDAIQSLTDPEFREYARQSAADGYTKNSDSFSVALVRDVAHAPELSATAAPIALLLLLGLLCLGVERRRRYATII